MNHYMLDLETLGNCTDGAIVTIGVVPFDPSAGTVDESDTFDRRVRLSDPALGVIEAGNVEFWMKQDAATREEALGASPIVETLGGLRTADEVMAISIPNGYWPSSWRRPLKIVLQELQQWLVGRGVELGKDGPWRLWAKPPEYDVRLLREAHVRVGLDFPFHFRSTRDMRTLLELGTMLGLERGPKAPDTMKHSALADAKWQATIVCAVIQELRKKKLKGTDQS